MYELHKINIMEILLFTFHFLYFYPYFYVFILLFFYVFHSNSLILAFLSLPSAHFNLLNYLQYMS